MAGSKAAAPNGSSSAANVFRAPHLSTALMTMRIAPTFRDRP
jgi:hypothetical protein